MGSNCCSMQVGLNGCTVGYNAVCPISFDWEIADFNAAIPCPVERLANVFIRIYANENERLSLSFEAFEAAVSSWPGMYFEPDGSFVWVMTSASAKLQLDGMLYDRGGAIEYLELKGDCTREAWRTVCVLLAQSAGIPKGPITEDAFAEANARLRIHEVDTNRWLRPAEIDAAISSS